MNVNILSIKSYFTVALFITAGTAFVTEADAAVATAKVTVKVVPAVSFSASNGFALSIPAGNSNEPQQPQPDSKQVEISSLNSSDPLKVNVSSGDSKLYDISISSESVVTGQTSTDSLTINNMKIDNSSLPLNTNEHELEIEGVVTIPASNNTDTYSGTTEITVNYN